jgi:cephalosporin hydroxylase
MQKYTNLSIDQERQEIIIDNIVRVPLYSPEGFRIISDLWIKVGWDQKYMYSFTWLGRPIIQIPDDVLRIQEVIYAVKPDLIIETGIAHGGSLILYASICKAIGKGRVVGVDIEIRPHNRASIEGHELFRWITLIEGNSISADVLRQIQKMTTHGETVLVILDSDHSYAHVSEELNLYSPFVTPGSYMVATDGFDAYIKDAPRASREYPNSKTWGQNNSKQAAEDFVNRNPAFKIVEPTFPFNEGCIKFRVTYCPSAFIQRIK